MHKFEKIVKVVNEYNTARDLYIQESEYAERIHRAENRYWDACERYERAMEQLNWWLENCPEFRTLYFAE